MKAIKILDSKLCREKIPELIGKTIMPDEYFKMMERGSLKIMSAAQNEELIFGYGERDYEIIDVTQHGGMSISDHVKAIKELIG